VNARLTLAVRVVVLTALVALTFGGSLAHLIEAAAMFGQHGRVGQAIALSVDLLAVAAGVELAERHRLGLRTWDALAVLLLTVVVTVAAQLVTAQASLGGWIAAAWPAVAFLSVVALIEFRPRPAPDVVVVPVRRQRQARTPDASPPVTGGPPVERQDTGGPLVPPRRSGVSAAVLAALESGGPGRVAELARRTGAGRTSVDYALGVLVEAGTVVRAPDLSYHLTESPHLVEATR